MLFKLLQKLFNLREKSREQRDENGDVVKPFLDHMEDLRWMLVKCAVVLIITMSVAAWFRMDLMELLQRPVDAASAKVGHQIKLRSGEVVAPFMISLKLAFYVGLIFAMPPILYFIAEFILPALTAKEKKILAPGFTIGFVLFLIGAAASYFYLIEHMLIYFYNDAIKMKIDPYWEWTNYIRIFTWLTIGFGLMCELPLVVILLAVVGIVSHEFLKSMRSYAVVLIMVLAMLVAPTPDPMTMLALSLPIIIMYEGCIWLVWLMESRRRKREQAAVVDELVS
jgi:sec-independent protein translocase protein TatC